MNDASIDTSTASKEEKAFTSSSRSPFKRAIEILDQFLRDKPSVGKEKDSKAKVLGPAGEMALTGLKGVSVKNEQVKPAMLSDSASPCYPRPVTLSGGAVRNEVSVLDKQSLGSVSRALSFTEESYKKPMLLKPESVCKPELEELRWQRSVVESENRVRQVDSHQDQTTNYHKTDVTLTSASLSLTCRNLVDPSGNAIPRKPLSASHEYLGPSPKTQDSQLGALAPIPTDWSLGQAFRVCYSCRELGHDYTQCPAPVEAVFCYNCVKLGRSPWECPGCAQSRERWAAALRLRRQRELDNRESDSREGTATIKIAKTVAVASSAPPQDSRPSQLGKRTAITGPESLLDQQVQPKKKKKKKKQRKWRRHMKERQAAAKQRREGRKAQSNPEPVVSGTALIARREELAKVRAEAWRRWSESEELPRQNEAAYTGTGQKNKEQLLSGSRNRQGDQLVKREVSGVVAPVVPQSTKKMLILELWTTLIKKTENLRPDIRDHILLEAVNDIEPWNGSFLKDNGFST